GIFLRLYGGTTCGNFTGTFAADLFSFSAGNSAAKFPKDSKNGRKQLPTKVVEENGKSREDLPSYHDMIHRGHDEAKLHAIVATMGAMDAQKKLKPS
ncbi:hypothetical protein L195_g048201, partial [Trifolium pratense]